jgi:beta-lactamase regulating signal transducer with metallopeptidase domain
MLLLLKASLLMVVALIAARLLRRAPAAVRHQLWSLGFAALLGLPLLAAALPGLDVPIPSAWRSSDATALTAARDDVTSRDRAIESIPGSLSGTTQSAGPAFSEQEVAATGLPGASPAGLVLRAIWLGGCLAAVSSLLLSFRRVRQMALVSRPLDDADWRQAAQRLGDRLGVRRHVHLVVSGLARTPMAGGMWRPTVFLPPEAVTWDAERRDIVLAHELAHLASRDPLRLVTARLALACYWFHPLAWVAAREASIAREQACDETVLALGIRASVYARTLLELAERTAPAPAITGALPMIQHSLLEKRLMTILTGEQRAAHMRHPVAVALATALITLPLAAARPAARGVSVTPPALRLALPLSASMSETTATGAAITAVSSVAPSTQGTTQGKTGGTGCGADLGADANFTGFTNTDRNGRVLDLVGTSGGSRIILRRFGDLRVCMSSDDVPGQARPSEWVGLASRVVLATERGGATERLEIRRLDSRVQQTWQVNGAERTFDRSAQAWRDALLAVMDRTWEIMSLRGEESALRGEISTLRGEESTLRGDISTVRGEVSTMRGRQSTILGEESTLRGRISEVQGHVSALRGQISAEQGAISSLMAERYGAGDNERSRIARQIAQHEAAIDRLERELRGYDSAAQIEAIERQISALDAEGKVAAIETEIRNFDEAAKTVAIERQIAALDIDRKATAIEQQIRTLDVDRRSKDLERQQDEALRRLEQALKAVR